jgi:antibiotic biosynthesis monooxygenase (ABM) superfamily enzyme
MHREPVTVVVSRRVKPGREAEYEQWIRDVTEVALPFEGHLGMNVFKPVKAGEPYVLVYKFDSGENLDRWLKSDVRAGFVQRAEDMCIESHAEHVSGLESWFQLPGAKAVLPPPKWKMALVTGCTVWVMGLGLNPLVREPLSGYLPGPVVALVATSVMVVLLTWIVMPNLTKLLRKWLFVDKS